MKIEGTLRRGSKEERDALRRQEEQHRSEERSAFLASLPRRLIALMAQVDRRHDAHYVCREREGLDTVTFTFDAESKEEYGSEFNIKLRPEYAWEDEHEMKSAEQELARRDERDCEQARQKEIAKGAWASLNPEQQEALRVTGIQGVQS